MNHSGRNLRVAHGCALALLLASGAARADSSGMDWLGVFYVWGADIGADYRDRSIDASFSDVVDKLDMGFMGHVEAQGDDFGGFTDLVYMSVSDSRSIGPASLRGELDMTLMDVALTWSPSAERFTGPEVYGGFRYLNIDAGLQATLLPPPGPDRQRRDRQELHGFPAGRPLRGADQRELAADLQRRPVRGRQRGHLEPCRLWRLPERPASLLRGLPAPGSRDRGAQFGARGHELFGARRRLRIRLLTGGSRDSASN